jgi:putative transposase
MKQRIERGQVPRIMEEYDRKDLAFLSLTVTRKVSGNIKSGHRPYIFYEGVEYRNDVLAKMPDLIGKNLTLLVNINDLRMIKAYLPDGSEFGILTAKGKWSIKPHTLKMRQEINRLKRNKDIHIYSYDDPIEVYHNFLVEKSDKNKSSRNKLATLNRVTKKLSNTLNKEAKDINESIKDTDNSTKRENNLTNSDNDRIEELKKSDIFKTLNF